MGEASQTTAELERSVSLLAAAFESTADGLLIVDRVGHIARYNQRFAQMWGIPLDILASGDEDRALAHVLDLIVAPEKFLERVMTLYASPDEVSEDLIALKDGRIFERFSRPQRLDQEIVGRVWSFRDVTEQHRLLRERKELLGEEQEALRQSRDTKRRVALIAAASQRLAASLDYETTLRTVAALAIPQFCDGCAFFLAAPGHVQRILIRHVDPDKERLLSEMFDRYPPALDAPTGLGRVYRTGKPLLIADVSDRFFEMLARSEEHRRYLFEARVTSYLAVPLPVGGRIIGVILFGMDRSGRRFDARDVELAAELARRCAVAIENARLFREAQEAVRRRDESLSQIDGLFRAAPIGLAFLDTQLRYLRFNDQLARTHGLNAERDIGRTVREANPGLADVIEPRLRRVIEQGEPVVGLELSGPTQTDPEQVRHWLVNCYPVRLEEGAILGLGVIVIDITERKRLEDERALHLREAKEAIQSRDDFLSVAAHELRTPLTSALLWLRLLQQSPSGANAARCMAMLRRQLRHLGELTNELLDVSRIRIGRIELHQRSEVHLAALVREVLGEMEQDIRRAGSQLEVQLDDSVRGRWDRMRIDEVVRNLLSNALKFGGGKPIQVEVGSYGGAAVLRVTDHGPGVELRDQQRIFERFERAVSAREFGGLGLGLYIVRVIVEAHGGQVNVTSQPAAGAVFTVLLPAHTGVSAPSDAGYPANR